MFDGFWNNVLRYFRYFITTLVGVALNTFAPLAPLLKNPITLFALIGFFIGCILFLGLTLRAMLGLSPL
jgi:Protein of unknown function (DUF751)